MAPKKKNILSPSSSSSPSPSSLATTTDPSPSSESDEVRTLLQRAFRFIPSDPDKAYKILNDARRRHKFSALFHCQRARVLHEYAESLDDPEDKKRRMQEAVASARRATELSPNNNEFSVCYVRLLLAASEGEGGPEFEEAAKECERALAIGSQTGFLFQKESQETTSADQISQHQKELQFMWNMLKSPIPSAKCKKTLAAYSGTFKIRSYLKSLTPEEWRDLLRVEVKDFRKFSTVTDMSLVVVNEALEFAQANHTWKFWICPRCTDQKFGDSESQLQHVLKEHVGIPSEELKSFFPKEVDQDWVNKLVSGSWEPIDVQATMMNGDQEWPLSDDAERNKLLKIIHAHFRMLIKHNYLSMSHLDKVLRYAIGEVQLLSSAPVLLNLGVNDLSALCIWVLDSFQLQKVLDFLQCLTQACKIGRYAEPHDPSDDVFLDSLESDVGVNAFLDDSLSYIDLDLKLLSSSADTSCPDDEISCFPDPDSMLFWLNENHNLGKKFSAWSQQREVRMRQADEILQKLEKEFEDLPTLCTEKWEVLEYQYPFQYEKDNCKMKLTEKETSLEVILMKRKEELAERAERGDDFVMSVISDVLKEAAGFKTSRNRDDAIIESDNNDADNSKIRSSLDNSCIEAAFQKLEESLDEKLGIIDAKIMKNLATTRQLGLNLQRTSSFDYLEALVPLLKTYLQMDIDEKIEELAKRESDAARDASLAELLHDAEISMDKRDDSQKQTQEKLKGKKKSSNSKKSKGRKC